MIVVSVMSAFVLKPGGRFYPPTRRKQDEFTRRLPHVPRLAAVRRTARLSEPRLNGGGAAYPAVRHRRREENGVDHVQHAAEARYDGRRVLALAVALDHRLG